jgi:hypothetical protein
MTGVEKIALNEWLLSGWRADELNGRLWTVPANQPFPSGW